MTSERASTNWKDQKEISWELLCSLKWSRKTKKDLVGCGEAVIRWNVQQQICILRKEWWDRSSEKIQDPLFICRTKDTQYDDERFFLVSNYTF